MFVFYRLLHRCVNSTPPGSSSATPPESSVPSPSSGPEKDQAILVWFTVFGLSLLFRPAAELVIRVLFFTACALLISTLDGALSLFVGHAVLRTAKYKGYDPSLLSSMVAGSLGGITVIWPTALATASLVALLGGLKLQRALSVYITLLLELVSVIAVSTAACSLGVTIVLYTHLVDGPLLDKTHAARAGALGACLLTVPIVSTAACLMRMRDAQTRPPAARNAQMATPSYPADNLDYPVNHPASSPRRPHRYVIAHTGAETVGYVLVTLCILTIRLLCF